MSKLVSIFWCHIITLWYIMCPKSWLNQSQNIAKNGWAGTFASGGIRRMQNALNAWVCYSGPARSRQKCPFPIGGFGSPSIISFLWLTQLSIGSAIFYPAHMYAQHICTYTDRHYVWQTCVAIGRIYTLRAGNTASNSVTWLWMNVSCSVIQCVV